MSQPRQGVLPWTIPSKPELPHASQQRCRELLSHMLLAATTHDPANTTANQQEEESDEREDPADTY